MQIGIRCIECEGTGEVETTPDYDYAPIRYGDCPACEGCGVAYFDIDEDNKTYVALSALDYMEKFAVCQWMMTDHTNPSDKQVRAFMETAVGIFTKQQVSIIDEALKRIEENYRPTTTLHQWVATIESEVKQHA